jgi:hypothetical protein
MRAHSARCAVLVAVLFGSARRCCDALPVTMGRDKEAECRDKLEGKQCELWAHAGECDKNPSFMRSSCARSCGCVRDRRCDGVSPPAKGTGGIHAMFERAERMVALGPRVHSREPFVLTFDRFVTDEECEAFISTTASHFERSLAGDMVSPVRTSKQAWCQQGIATECYNHPLTRRVAERVANVTGVPVPNAEFAQVLKYEPGQFYKVKRGARHTTLPSACARAPLRGLSRPCAHGPQEHHDQNANPNSVMGVRLFTFFIYLHSPEGGGGTRFPKLNITIQPRKGSALLWPNVLDHDLRREDSRTMHEALPPIAGLKYSANLWLHQYDFRTPNMAGCDMRKAVDRSEFNWPTDDEELATRTNRTLSWPVMPSDATQDGASNNEDDEELRVEL